MISLSVKQFGRSFLFPKTNKGISARVSQLNRCSKLFFAMSIFSLSALSNTNTMQSELAQYFSQLSLYLLYPPKS